MTVLKEVHIRSQNDQLQPCQKLYRQSILAGSSKVMLTTVLISKAGRCGKAGDGPEEWKDGFNTS